MRGWVKLLNAKKFHWIEDGRSLCGKWGYFGKNPEAYDQDTTEKRDECKECRRKLNKENRNESRD